MKYFVFILLGLTLLLLAQSCAKVNPFQEPPDHPVIDSLTPATGGFGTQLRLYGSGFSTNTSEDSVYINGVRVRVDSPSTSTVLLVTIVDSTGTGKVAVKVRGQQADGPVFTWLGNGNGGPAPIIKGADYPVLDGSGYGINMSTVPASDNDITVRVGGVTVSLYHVVRPGDATYDPDKGPQIQLQDDQVEPNAVDIYASFQVLYKGIASNVFPFQVRPHIDDIFSRHGDYAFAAGDTLIIQGNFLGTRTLSSLIGVRYNGQTLAQPQVLSWTNKEIKAVMPSYTQVLVGAGIPISVIVGQKESTPFGVKYLGVISGTASLVAGNGNTGTADGTGAAAQFNNPAGLAVDGAGIVYVADQSNNRIRKISNITANGGTVTTLAGSTAGFRDGGNADAWFNQPSGVAIDENGVIYVSDQLNNRIRTIHGNIVSTFSGDGDVAKFYYPTGLATRNHNLIVVADMNNNRIQQVLNATIFTLAGSTSGFADGTGTAAKFQNPYGVAITADGTIYVADAFNHAIRKIAAGGIVTTLAGGTDGNADGTGSAAQFQLPKALAVDGSGNIYVADFSASRLRKVTPAGVVTTFSPSLADGTPASFLAPNGIAIDGAGNIYVSDAGTHSIYKIVP